MVFPGERGGGKGPGDCLRGMRGGGGGKKIVLDRNSLQKISIFFGEGAGELFSAIVAGNFAA